MKNVKTLAAAGVLLAAAIGPTTAMAEPLTPPQEWACRWDGGLTPQQVEEVLGVPGWYLGGEERFPDRPRAWYSFYSDAGVVVGYIRGQGGELISSSLDVAGFKAPDWFGEECRSIAKAHRPPPPPPIQITPTPCTLDPQTGELHCD